MICDFNFAVKSKIEFWNKKMGTSITEREWNSWIWQEQNRITTLEDLKKLIPIEEKKEKEIEQVLKHFKMAVTPYFVSYVGLLYSEEKTREAADALCKTFLPDIAELIDIFYDPMITQYNVSDIELLKIDGLGEENTTPFSYISRLYLDRALLFVTSHCPFYCRYCFRRRKVITSPNSSAQENILQSNNLEKAMDFLKDNPEIRDVILSGGEPLTLNDTQLEKILLSLREIKHIKIIRIDTKIPAIMPMRITDSLVTTIRKYHPVFMTLHFVHPYELTPESKKACEKLVDGGIPLGTYTGIYKGINDNREILKQLFWELVQARIRPYYLVQFVPTKHAEHFRVPLEKSLSILEGLHGELSGIAIPSFKVYTYGQGKVPLLPAYYRGKIKEGHLLKTYKGEVALYPEPLDKKDE